MCNQIISVFLDLKRFIYIIYIFFKKNVTENEKKKKKKLYKFTNI